MIFQCPGRRKAGSCWRTGRLITPAYCQSRLFWLLHSLSGFSAGLGLINHRLDAAIPPDKSAVTGVHAAPMASVIGRHFLHTSFRVPGQLVNRERPPPTGEGPRHTSKLVQAAVAAQQVLGGKRADLLDNLNIAFDSLFNRGGQLIRLSRSAALEKAFSSNSAVSERQRERLPL